MATFHYKARKSSAITTGTVDAPTREDAISQIVGTAAPGEEIEVMQVQEEPGPAEGPTGATGTAASMTGVSGPTGKHHR
jgi:hypothetical protein